MGFAMITDDRDEGVGTSDDELTTLSENELMPAHLQQQDEQTSVVPMGGGEGDEDEDSESLSAYQHLRAQRAAKKRKRRIKIAIVAALIGGLAAVWVAHRMFLANNPDDDADLAPQIAMVERTDFSNVISASGALKAGSTVVVTPEVDGTIESIRVSEGQEVKKGDVLFTLKNDELDKLVREAAADLEAARQGVASAQREVGDAEAARNEAWTKYDEDWCDADAAHREWQNLVNNYDSLHAAWEKAMRKADKYKCSEPNAPVEVSPPDGEKVEDQSPQFQKLYKKYLAEYEKYLKDKDKWDKYQEALAAAGEEPQPAGEEPVYPDKPDDISLVSAIEGAREGVVTANQTLTKASEAYDEAVANAEKRTVTAPSSGNIVAMNAKVGQALGGATSGYEDGSSSSGSNDALVQIANMNQMAVDIEVNEIDILSIEKEQWAKITFSALEDVELDAQVQEVSTVASNSGSNDMGGGGVVTFHVGLVIPNPDPKLRPGMTADVSIYTADLKDVLVVPAMALIDDGEGGTYVEVVTEEGDEETGEGFLSEQRAVTVGERSSSEAVIESGLEEGELIVVSGGMGAMMGAEGDAALDEGDYGDVMTEEG